MKYSKYFTLLLFILTGVSTSFAQTEEEYDSITDNLLFRKEMNGSVIIHSQGWGLEYRFGHNRTVFKKLMYEANLLEMKDAKEIRTINPFFTNTKSYIYGKMNALYIVRLGINQQHMLNRKPYFGGVELRAFYAGGLSVGFAKPVYLEIVKMDMSLYQPIIVVERYDPDKHFNDNIYGRAPFTKGFDKLKPYPGAYVKAGLSIDFGTLNQKPKIVEVGAVLDLYAKPIPVMAFKNPDQFFLTIYLSFGIGKRYD
ncbi:MAG: hypothetical protein IPN08_02870 [Bacteroidales bacterium]|nr:hypothetical protein [Bacteroidales bacterium]MBK9356323.1 hypothetical protein [Bacteroidales bacterium]